MENKKNIWIISQYTGSPYHGMNYRGYYLAREFVKKGHSVTIFTGSYSHLFINPPQIKESFTEENIDGINYIWVKTPRYKSSKSIKRVWSMLAFMFRLLFFKTSTKEKPDKIIISSLSLFPVLNAYIWSKIFKIEFIFEVRDIWPLTLIEVGGFSKYHPLTIVLGWFEKFGYKKAQYVVSLLPYAKSHMLKNGMNENKFQYIPNGVNLDEVENYTDISDDIKKLLPKDKFIVGYLGTIGIANALEYLIQSAKLLNYNNNIHFVLIGEGGELERLKKYTNDNLLNNITFIPPISKIEVQGMLKLFDICYIGWHNKSIYKYGISANKIFDYMYSAKPILHSINLENDIISNANCGVTIKAEDIQEIAKAILDLSSKSIETLDKMGQNGKAYVIKYHSYSSLATKYINLL